MVLWLNLSAGASSYPKWCYAVAARKSSPQATPNGLCPFVVNRAIKQVLSKFECLNYENHQWDSRSPLGQTAHRSKALDAYSIMSSLDPVSIEFWVDSQPAARGAPKSWTLPSGEGIVQ